MADRRETIPDTLLTISLSDGVYSVSSDPCKVELGGKLSVTIPQGPPVGCLLCFTSEFGDSKSHKLLQDKTFDLSKYPNASAWTYTVWDPSTPSCPSQIVENPPHSIQVGSGMGGV
jgi:hypothetical protein